MSYAVETQLLFTLYVVWCCPVGRFCRYSAYLDGPVVAEFRHNNAEPPDYH